ncbi:hypothetical protein GCM10027271_24090 [Saccharopolyspora gloriosae]
MAPLGAPVGCCTGDCGDDHAASTTVTRTIITVPTTDTAVRLLICMVRAPHSWEEVKAAWWWRSSSGGVVFRCVRGPPNTPGRPVNRPGPIRGFGGGDVAANSSATEHVAALEEYVTYPKYSLVASISPT